jgi:hypothetical protein
VTDGGRSATYVALTVVVWLDITITVWLTGALQPLTVLKLTVWLPTARPKTVAALG